MLEYREIPETNVVELVVDGAISAAEFDDVVARLGAAIERHGKICLLKEVRELGGVPASKWWQDLKFGYQHLRDIRRAAVVAHPKWIEAFANLVNPFLATEVRYFEPSEIDQARQWLREPPEKSGDG